MFKTIIGAAAVASASATVTRTLKDAPVENGFCDATVKSSSGYFNVKSGVDKNYFHWFFESRSETQATDPVIVWLTGGPGCSSQLALLAENGPCAVSEDGMSTVNNPFSWNSNANIRWGDQPANVGYSYGDKIRDMDHDEEEVGEDMYWFLQEFYKTHTDLVANPLYIFGESYGGHYAPNVAHRIFQGNNRKEGDIHINLAGVGVGNGLTDPVIQYQYYPEMAMNNSYGIKTISEEAYSNMLKHEPRCTSMAKACQLNHTMCEDADTYCQLTMTMPYYNTDLNPYDIRVPCGEDPLCYDFSNIDTFLNLDSTREALHVDDAVDEWVDCNTVVNAGFISDWMRDYQQVLIPMLESDIDVLIYAGDVDFICNWIGNKAWTKALNWSGKSDFNDAADVEWDYTESATGKTINGGLVRSANAAKGSGSLTFLQVFEAGHMVPMDKPEAALSLLNTFIQQKEFVPKV